MLKKIKYIKSVLNVLYSELSVFSVAKSIIKEKGELK
jgi:hypothetical protein